MKKKYYNPATHEWYTEGNSITKYIDGSLFSGIPSVELLTEWGFEEWVEPTPTPEELLQRAKNAKIAELEAYDASEAVNAFTIGGVSMWLSVGERQQIATQISASEAVGRTEMTRWFGGTAFIFPLNRWRQMLVALEVYAGDAINVTESHRAAINDLDTIEAVEGYDYSIGYPLKLSF